MKNLKCFGVAALLSFIDITSGSPHKQDFYGTAQASFDRNCTDSSLSTLWVFSGTGDCTTYRANDGSEGSYLMSSLFVKPDAGGALVSFYQDDSCGPYNLLSVQSVDPEGSCVSPSSWGFFSFNITQAPVTGTTTQASSMLPTSSTTQTGISKSEASNELKTSRFYPWRYFLVGAVVTVWMM